MNVRKGTCVMCKKVGIVEDHHVVEVFDENGDNPIVAFCDECHVKHERYRHYLEDKCNVKFDQTKKSENS